MSLLIRTLRKEIDELHEKGIKLSLIGEIDQLPNSVQKPLHHAVELTQENQKANLIIALNYGSKAEILKIGRASCRERVKISDMSIVFERNKEKDDIAIHLR